MSTVTANAANPAAPAKPKSKKRLFILIGAVVLALITAGGAFYILKKNTTTEEESEEAYYSSRDDRASRLPPPSFVPLESMVVNLADPGGNRFAQLGITLQVEDAKTAEEMKVYMPSIRSTILMLISQRTSENMLQMEGKSKLSADIVREVSLLMDFPLPTSDEVNSERSVRPVKKTRVTKRNPLQAVLFSSFIVQ